MFGIVDFDFFHLGDARENRLAHGIQRVLHGFAFVRRKYRKQHFANFGSQLGERQDYPRCSSN